MWHSRFIACSILQSHILYCCAGFGATSNSILRIQWFRKMIPNRKSEQCSYERNIGQEMNVSMINRTFYLKFHHQLMSQMWRSFLCIRSTAENNWFFPVNFNSLTSIHPKNGSNLSSQRGKNILHTINLFPVFSFYFNHHHCVRWWFFVRMEFHRLLADSRCCCLCLLAIFQHNLHIGQTKVWPLWWKNQRRTRWSRKEMAWCTHSLHTDEQVNRASSSMYEWIEAHSECT